MSNPFFDHPILNSPYDCPQRHWELDTDGQPTQQVIASRRRAEFITPIPKPKKRKTAAQQHHNFSGVRPFFCQVEAAETAIWLTEVAPQTKGGKLLLDHLASANNDANPSLMRLALKLSTGAGKTTVMTMLIEGLTL